MGCCSSVEVIGVDGAIAFFFFANSLTVSPRSLSSLAITIVFGCLMIDARHVRVDRVASDALIVHAGRDALPLGVKRGDEEKDKEEGALHVGANNSSKLREHAGHLRLQHRQVLLHDTPDDIHIE